MLLRTRNAAHMSILHTAYFMTTFDINWCSTLTYACASMSPLIREVVSVSSRRRSYSKRAVNIYYNTCIIVTRLLATTSKMAKGQTLRTHHQVFSVRLKTSTVTSYECTPNTVSVRQQYTVDTGINNVVRRL